MVVSVVGGCRGCYCCHCWSFSPGIQKDRKGTITTKTSKHKITRNEDDFKKYYKQYTENGVLVFVIDKTVKDEETREQLLSKVAFHNDMKEDKLTAWDTADKEIGTKMMKVLSKLPGEAMVIVTDTLNSEVSNLELAKEKKVRE